MSEENRLPDISGADGLRIGTAEYARVRKEITQLSKDGKDQPCQWCGEANWQLQPTVYTHTVFDISKDRHNHNKVFAHFLLSCMKCGSSLTFPIEKFGLTTKGGIPKGGNK